jgi:hypothetical protein
MMNPCSSTTLPELREQLRPYINQQGELENAPIELEKEVYLHYKATTLEMHEFKRAIGLAIDYHFSSLGRRVRAHYKFPVNYDGDAAPKKAAEVFVPVNLISKSKPTATMAVGESITIKFPDGIIVALSDWEQAAKILAAVRSR